VNKRTRSESNIIILTCDVVKITIKKIKYKKINKRIAKIYKEKLKIELVIVIKEIKKINYINMLKDKCN